MNDIFELNFLEGQKSFAEFAIPLTFHLITGIIIIYGLYYRKMQRKDYFTAFSLISITVFFLVILLVNVRLQFGFALGLFAIFGIIRYRTISIQVKEMTYLFVIIGVSVINALASSTIGYTGLALVNIMFILACWLFESSFTKNHISVKKVRYDNIHLIKAGMEHELKVDLEKRLGLSIIKIEIGTVNFIKDSAVLLVSYLSKDADFNTAEKIEDNETDPDGD
jgi:hypothetical protein